ncbi:helix-turn-helix domain-containing protein [uncultured Deefgea sp.]|uniref:helix-turn-helix domain-containing protein n=1 Tax=uncultured Deefgea sp. TaxID=1304914 RepID=UPI002620CE28|nr:helix-turn-helix transcriptional regulator [uncultured Deefgea sp.]
MSFIGGRLLDERERLGLSQTELSEKCGIAMRSQRNYEKGERVPDAEYLAALAASGADVLYILTGQRQGQGIGESAVHQAVLDAVDLLSLEKKVDANQLAKAVVKLAVKSATAPTFSTAASKFDINFGQATIGQNITIHGEHAQVNQDFKPGKK